MAQILFVSSLQANINVSLLVLGDDLGTVWCTTLDIRDVEVSRWHASQVDFLLKVKRDVVC